MIVPPLKLKTSYNQVRFSPHFNKGTYDSKCNKRVRNKVDIL